jgi:hypothetical protein
MAAHHPCGRDPPFGKPLKLTVEIRYTEKILETDREKMRFLRKRPFPSDATATEMVYMYVKWLFTQGMLGNYHNKNPSWICNIPTART